jgi:hypothetical protein
VKNGKKDVGSEHYEIKIMKVWKLKNKTLFFLPYKTVDLFLVMPELTQRWVIEEKTNSP